MSEVELFSKSAVKWGWNLKANKLRRFHYKYICISTEPESDRFLGPPLQDIKLAKVHSTCKEEARKGDAATLWCARTL